MAFHELIDGIKSKIKIRLCDRYVSVSYDTTCMTRERDGFGVLDTCMIFIAFTYLEGRRGDRKANMIIVRERG